MKYYRTDYMEESESVRTDRNPDESVHIVCYCPAYNRPAGVCCDQPVHLCLLEFFWKSLAYSFRNHPACGAIASCLQPMFAVLPYAIKWTQTHALVCSGSCLSLSVDSEIALCLSAPPSNRTHFFPGALR